MLIITENGIRNLYNITASCQQVRKISNCNGLKRFADISKMVIQVKSRLFEKGEIVLLNEKLSFEQCMSILNTMSKYVIDWDSDYDGIIYIIIDPCMIDYLGMLFANEEELEKYLHDYGENWKEEGFDITGIWGEIDRVFKKDIWWSKKKGFYVRKWHHKVIYAIRTKLRDYKSKYKNFMSKQRRKAYYRKREKEQRKRIKQFIS